MLNNRKAYYNYHILEEYEAGLKLTGENVKQLVCCGIDLSTSYCYIDKGEMFVANMPFHDNNTKKLLMHKKEILKIFLKIHEKALSIIPLKIYEKNNKFKMVIGLGKPKKNYDKREAIKDREIKRNLKNI